MLLDCDPSGCPPDTAEARSQMYVYIYIHIMHGVHFHVATRTANI